MPTPTIPAGNLFMNATLYTGNGSTQTITNGAPGQSFQPDLIWLKRRNGVGDNGLYDSIRGISLRLVSNSTGAEASVPLDSFNSNGFSTTSNYNNSGETLVAWQWKAGGAAVTNTTGSISAQVSANTTAGFSVVTYTGTGVTGTLGHGLGIAPAMIIVKSRSNASNWYTYHKSIGNTGAVALNLTNATITSANFWNNTSPTSSVFTASAGSAEINGNGLTYVAYCWSEVAGYSKFGSYTGNGSTDGSFVFTGFRPRFIMWKNATQGSQWILLDTARNTYNVSNAYLEPNTSDAENTASTVVDILSNGFKLRNAGGTDFNENANTYIYAAFAENPFKYANAR